MERKKTFSFLMSVESRLAFVYFGMIFGITILVVFLMKTQIIKGDYYISQMENQSLRSQHLPSARGLIRDRYGVILADNKPTFFVELYLKEMIRSFPKGVPIPYKINKGGHKVEDVGIIVQSRIPRLIEKLDIPESAATVRSVERHYDQQPFEPYRVNFNLDQERLAKFYENSPIISGADITVVASRFYPQNDLASHILGYVGKFERPPEKNENNNFDFAPEFIGKQGIEKYFDQYLQGEEGGRMIRVNTKGFIEEKVSEHPALPGGDVYLTIDGRMQQIVENALKSVGRGAAVLVDVYTGEILAMASIPSFDPNAFVPAISRNDWARLNNDSNTPLFDRSVSAYPPGSIFKPVIALAALETGKAKGDTVIDCTQGMQIGNHFFKCWSFGKQYLGPMNMRRAIAMSANVYFYVIGLRAGPEAIYQTGKKLGFGESTGLEIANEMAGVMPGPGWLKKMYPKDFWGAGYTANTSIGQGFVLVTPLQMAMMTSTIANGGTLYKPNLVSKIVDVNGQVVVQSKPVIKNETGFKMENLKVIREGMLQVVENGTGGKGGVPGIKIAGKTGTAQAWRRLPSGAIVKDNKTWFISFAPFDKPKYALVVMVEGGVSGGATSAPVAGQIWNQIFSLPEVKLGEAPEPLSPEFFTQTTGVQAQLAPEQATTPESALNPAGTEALPIDTIPEEISEPPKKQEKSGDPKSKIRGARGLRM